MDATVVPRLLLGAVDGVEMLAVGALQLTRDVVVTAVSGVANVGAEAVTATMAGTRGIVSATARMVGDVAGAAQETVRATIDNARRSRRGLSHAASRLPAVTMTDASAAETKSAPTRRTPRSRRRAGLRLATSRPSEAA
jgi:hypothetical protein